MQASDGDTRTLDQYRYYLTTRSEQELAKEYWDLHGRWAYDWSQHGWNDGSVATWLEERRSAVVDEQDFRRESRYFPSTKRRWLSLMGAGVVACVAASVLVLGGLRLLGGSGAHEVARREQDPHRVVQETPVEPCSLTTHADFWAGRLSLAFDPVTVLSGDEVTAVVTTDAEGGAVIAQDLEGFHLRVDGQELMRVDFRDNRLTFRGTLASGDPGVVDAELLHGDYVFAETTGGCLTRAEA